MKFSEKILLLRKRAGLSQEELANRLDVSRQTVYKWESETSMPEIPKIKAIARLFRVSFDYLMDDEIEELDAHETSDSEETDAPRQAGVQRAVRAVSRTGIKLSYSQVDIDNGHAPSRTTKQKNDGYLGNRIKIMRSALARVGATEIKQLQNGATTAFFYDAKRRVIGFYYAGRIQFVCPIENIRAFRFGGARTDTTAWALLSYKDGEEIKELRLDFTVNTHFVLDMVAKDGVEMLELTWSAMMGALLQNLQELEIKIAALMEEGKRLITAGEELAEVDVAFYEKENQFFGNEYEAYLNEIEQDAAKSATRQMIRRIVKWSLVGAAVILVISLIF